MEYTYKPEGVCPSKLDFEVVDGKVRNVRFYGGCNGNLKAISKLIEGMDKDEVISLLKGNTCGFKNTSCADQLAIALEKAE